MDKPKIYEGEGEFFDLTKIAEAGYEIHGKKHREFMSGAFSEGIWFGGLAVIAANIVWAVIT